ncbi:NAD(P)H-hydrate dehydratase [Eggerthellaceae bacterium zg-887]|uniref:NAD(P)H-hydrate dehydratase n=1 Tax=Xiamenia xianingshaonis TaxID=2682776 RepID=UPI00140DED0E|nr:NAD(P)H-hydrate dehydratase [Xiamenia xianingshaonis]NHM15446.1 NAD(P)H-hydrate dehydratase [Xiamenia xianingshaonis]
METVSYSMAHLAALVPYPPRDANKYTRGRLVCAVGCDRYPGAAVLASRGAEVMGAGYTQVVTDASVAGHVRAANPSVVVSVWPDVDPAQLPSAREGHPCAYVVGSGYDAGDSITKIRTRLVLENAQAPVLLDAGSLDAATSQKLRDILERRARDGFANVFTPHGGEAARMARPLGIETDDAPELARQLARAYCGTVMLKGPVTYVCDGETVVRMDEGTAALAKAGTGDVLAGMTGALLAQGLSPLDACVLGATLHALAGQEAAKCLTDICVRAEDVVASIPQALMRLAQAG